jgi:hypothetical protein
LKGGARESDEGTEEQQRFLTHKKLRRFKAGGRTLVRMSDLMLLVKEEK